MISDLRRSILRRIPARLLPALKSLQLSLTLAGGTLLRSLPGTSVRFGPPRRLCLTLRDYVAARRQTGTPGHYAYIELYPAETLSRIPPPGTDGDLPREFLAEMTRIAAPSGVAAIGRGRVLTATGAVIAPGDCLIDEVSHSFIKTEDPRANELFLSIKLPPVQAMPGALAVLTTRRSDNYFHWLFDTLPRLCLLEQSGFCWDRVVAPQRTRFQRESLELIGVATDRIIAEPRLHLEAETLVVPSLPGKSGNPPRWACGFLRERLLAKTGHATAPRQRVYVSRRQSGTRQIVNEAELLGVLRRHGFASCFLEDLSFVEQIALFCSADAVVSAHGSGLSNLIFCAPGTGVVELFSPCYVNVCYWALANQLGLDYRYVLGRARHGLAARSGALVHENIEIDPAKVEAALLSLEAPRGRHRSASQGRADRLTILP